LDGFVTIALLLAAWLTWAWFCARMHRRDTRKNESPEGSPLAGMAISAIRIYARLRHNVRADVVGDLPAQGPLIVISNHTAGVDPVLVQACLPFEVRWMMGKDMRIAGLEAFWAFARIIDVDRKGRDTASARRAIAHVRDGGVLGVFPEGRIAKQAGTMHPFLPGIGLIVHATGAPVLPVVIQGTPRATTAWGSLTMKSNSTLRIGPVLRPAGKAHDVTEALEAHFRRTLEKI
jgi:1-acyl-sn-glycerol-3-phosphate acyltransferase